MWKTQTNTKKGNEIPRKVTKTIVGIERNRYISLKNIFMTKDLEFDLFRTPFLIALSFFFLYNRSQYELTQI